TVRAPDQHEEDNPAYTTPHVVTHAKRTENSKDSAHPGPPPFVARRGPEGRFPELSGRPRGSSSSVRRPERVRSASPAELAAACVDSRCQPLSCTFLAPLAQRSRINARHEVQRLHRRTRGHEVADGSAAWPGATAVLRRMRATDDRASAPRRVVGEVLTARPG